jgi:hypothetical protein
MDSKNPFDKESYKLVLPDRKNQRSKHKVPFGLSLEKSPLDIVADLDCIQ